MMTTIWQTFRGGPTKAYKNGVGVSINKVGHITLSRGAYQLIGDPSHVLMHYDDRNSVIGVTRTEPGTPGAFAVRLRPGGCGCTIYITPFCRHFRIQMEGTERFDAPELGPDGVLRLDLKRTHRVAQQNPRSKRDHATTKVTTGSDNN
ncbi:MAG: hypothetical protein ABJA02_02135 [Acidobacteriota bacterium]